MRSYHIVYFETIDSLISGGITLKANSFGEAEKLFKDKHPSYLIFNMTDNTKLWNGE